MLFICTMLNNTTQLPTNMSGQQSQALSTHLPLSRQVQRKRSGLIVTIQKRKLIFAWFQENQYNRYRHSMGRFISYRVN